MIEIKRIKVIISIIIVLIAICLIENSVICYVVSESEVSNMSDESSVFFHYYGTTDGTEFVTEYEDDGIAADNKIHMMLLKGRVNPRLLRVNDHFLLDGNAKFMTIPKRATSSKYNGEKVLKIYPNKLFIVLNEDGYAYDVVKNSSHNGKFYVKDLSLGGHVYFYLAPILHFLNIVD